MRKVPNDMYFCGEIQKFKEMDKQITQHKVPGIEVKMYLRDSEYEKRLLRGRVLLDSDEKSLLFAQNEPRTKFSREVMRTEHGRLVCRPDGLYTFTFSKVNVDERNLRELLLAELRTAATAMKSDSEKRKRKEKEGK